MKRPIKLLAICSVLFATLLAVPALARHTPSTLCPPGTPESVTECIQPATGATDIPTLIGIVIRAILGIVGSIALVMFVYGGFTWLTSHGNPKLIEKGKQTLVWAIIGLAFIFSSYIILEFVLRALTG